MLRLGLDQVLGNECRSGVRTQGHRILFSVRVSVSVSVGITVSIRVRVRVRVNISVRVRVRDAQAEGPAHHARLGA